MMVKREWTLSRNCSITPRQLGLAYAGLCTASLSVAIFFTWHGAWYVLGFSLLELTAVGVAFLLYARHATDREYIALIDDCLLVEVIQVEQVRQYRLDSRWIRVDVPVSHNGLIGLESRGTRVEVGRFLTESKRHEFAGELQRTLVSNN